MIHSGLDWTLRKNPVNTMLLPMKMSPNVVHKKSFFRTSMTISRSDSINIKRTQVISMSYTKHSILGFRFVNQWNMLFN